MIGSSSYSTMRSWFRPGTSSNVRWPPRPTTSRRLLGVLAVCGIALAASDARAMCNVIPAATQDFRAALGSVNRPFAGPGEFVEIRVRPAICDSASTGFVDVDRDGSKSDDHVVTVLFVPPNGGTPNAVVLAENCDTIDLTTCTAQLNGGSATCRTANDSDFPGTQIRVPSLNELQFSFPNTDDHVAATEDGLTLVGPARLVVTRAGAPLRCELAQIDLNCADLDLSAGTPTTGVVACVDELFKLDGTCRVGAEQIDLRFGHFTALPPPNDYQHMCTTPDSACEGTDPNFQFTTDVAGNVLIPMDYTGILLRKDGVPIPQLSRATIEIEKFGPGSGKEPGNLTIPSAALISSYSPEGVVLPPVFTPLSDPTASDKTTLFGSVDAGLGVIRLSRGVCSGGDDAGERCNTAAECQSNICSELFDFRDRYCDGVGPIVVGGPLTSCTRSGGYDATLDTPVPLAGLITSQDVFAFVLSESLDDTDRNGDGDTRDFVATLRNRDTGLSQPLGPDNGTVRAEGRAVTQVRFQTLIDFGDSATSTDIFGNSATSTAIIIRQATLQFPAVETEGDIVAFLESEPAQNRQDVGQPDVDVNGNFNLFDSILRVFRLGTIDEISNPSGEEPLTADAAPVINGRSMVVSQGRVFFRTTESAEAIQTLSRVSVGSDGTETTVDSQSIFHAISADGRFVAFDNADRSLDGEVSGQWTDVFVRDRDADENGIFDEFEPGAVETTRVSVNSEGVAARGSSGSPSISANGRFIAFDSVADNLDPDGDTNGASDVFVHDRSEHGTTRVSVDSSGVGGNSQSQLPSISANGRFVAFESDADNLVPGDGNGLLDVFVHDRDAATTIRVSLGMDAAEANGASFGAAISADGRFVAFSSEASNLVDGDTNGTLDVFVHDLITGTTARISVDSTGGEAIGFSTDPAISADGRFVSFESSAANLTPFDSNGLVDLFVRDRDADQDGVFDERGGSATIRVRLDSLDFAAATSISANGRFLAFDSNAPDIVLDDNNSNFDVFVHDRVTGHTTRVSVGALGEEGLGNSGRVDGAEVANVSISSDGSFVAFQSVAPNLLGDDDGNGHVDLFVRGADTTDLTIDRSMDNELNDAVLRVLDTTSVGAPVADLCPAEIVAVSAGRAAFLRPEGAGVADNLMCMTTDLMGPDLNGDEDLIPNDLVVHLYADGVVDNLRCAAEDVVMSETHVAALVSEAAQGNTDLNFDGDTDDLVLHIWKLGVPAPSTCDSWLNTEQAGDAIAITGDVVAMITSEAAQNGEDLNGDGDSDDRVVRIFDAATGALIEIVDEDGLGVNPQAAVEFVLGTELLAFRTSEASQGQGSLNDDDDDTDDDMLQIYDLKTGELFKTGQTVVPCPLLACDPKRPYRVSSRTVRFLTLESDQNADKNDDGDKNDLLVQVFNTESRQAKVVAEVVDTAIAATSENAAMTGTDPLATPSEEDPDAGGQQVLVSSGRCVADTQVSCVSGAGGECLQGEFCFIALGDMTGSCVRDSGQTCFPDKPVDETGCPPNALCINDFVVIGIADADNDQIPDAIDNCPDILNVDQADKDNDGVGDRCDLQTCGDSSIQLQEQCDDGNLIDNDGCDSNCRLSDFCGNGIVSANEQCDDGNVFDGDGCDSSCRLEICGDGIVSGSEQCDDGNLVDGDGCSSFCQSEEDCAISISRVEIPGTVRLKNTSSDDGKASIKEKSVKVIATLGSASGRSCPVGTTRDAEVRLLVRAGESNSDLFQGTISTNENGSPLQLTSGENTKVKFLVEFDPADCNGPFDKKGRNQRGTLSYTATAKLTQAGPNLGDIAETTVSGKLMCKSTEKEEKSCRGLRGHERAKCERVEKENNSRRDHDRNEHEKQRDRRDDD